MGQLAVLFTVAGKSQTAPMIFFSLPEVIFLKFYRYKKPLRPHVLSFLPHIILDSAGVVCKYFEFISAPWDLKIWNFTLTELSWPLFQHLVWLVPCYLSEFYWILHSLGHPFQIFLLVWLYVMPVFCFVQYLLLDFQKPGHGELKIFFYLTPNFFVR